MAEVGTMCRFVRWWPALAILGLILGTFPSAAKADAIETVTFTVDITSGPETGDVYTGSYSYDATVLAADSTAPLLTFTFTDPAWTGYTLSSPGVAQAKMLGPAATDFDVFFAPGTSTADNAFDIGEGEIGYGTTTIEGVAFLEIGPGGGGTVSYDSFTSTPEPRSIALLAIGLIGLLPFRRKSHCRGRSDSHAFGPQGMA
jgi:hypothetical protein